LARARAVVALSEFNRAQLVEWIGVPERKIRVVPNGVPAAAFSPADEAARRAARAALGLDDRATILVVGALVPEKGVDVAIECAGRLPHAQLVVAGDGPARNSLESLAAARAPGRVRFLGSLPDIVPAYHAADMIVFPSRGGDAMPAALLEAGLCGLPAVATAVGAIPEVIVDDVTGVVVAAADPGPIAEALGALLADADRRRTLGHAARARCLAKYSIEAVAGAWERVLRECLGAA
jgi:glycosyltransferase involved in cell wall biosynthesis